MNMDVVFRKPKLLRALTSLDAREFARLEAGLEEWLALERQERTQDGAKRQRAYGAGNVGKLPVRRSRTRAWRAPASGS
jgi:hypothetical protein